MDCSTLLGVMMEVQTCIQLNTTILQAIHGHLFLPQWKLVEGNSTSTYRLIYILIHLNLNLIFYILWPFLFLHFSTG